MLYFVNVQLLLISGALAVTHDSNHLLFPTVSDSSHASAPVLNKSLEEQLRAWWGDSNFREFQENLTDDLRDVGFELAEEFNQTVHEVMSNVIAKRSSNRTCATLPLKLSLHAWRYNQQDLDHCLTMDKGPISCTMRCDHLPKVTVVLKCQESNGSWSLTGSPPKNYCRSMLDTEILNTSGGLVQGIVRPIPFKWVDGHVSMEMTRTFWGIPYADKPERFQLSQPLSKRWSGVRVTDSRTDNSKQMHCAGWAPLDKGNGTEDCLFLDIFVPPRASEQNKRPVMAVLFAGGFIIGDAWQQGRNDGSRIALRDDVVMVVLSTRTAALGHWAHPALSKEYGDSSAGNIGERDQRQALKWIHANIYKFGGDPKSVTLWGHSSGAFDAAFHLASPGSQGLFAGAVLESTTFDSAWYWQSREQAFTFYAQLGEAMGCPQDNGNGMQIKCLRALPIDAFYNIGVKQLGLLAERMKSISPWSDAWSIVKSILAATFGTGGGFHKAGLHAGDSEILATPLWPVLPYGIVVDGTDAGVPANPRELIQADAIADVPVYVNHEHNEGTIFAMMLAFAFPWQKEVELTHTAVEAILSWAFDNNATFTKELFQHYPRGIHDNAPFYRLSRIIGDSVFKCSTWRFAEARSKKLPGQIFYAEHTFAGSSVRSTSAAGAIRREDFGYFFGAQHCLPTPQTFGFQYMPGGAWAEVDQMNHNLIHCHLTLMLHCGDPGVEVHSPCGQRLETEGVLPRACQNVTGSDMYPFAAFDPNLQHRNQLHPTNHTVIVPSMDEINLCKFWDAAPSMNFQPNSCRGCASNTIGSETFVV